MQQLLDRIHQIQPTGVTGSVSGTTGTTVEVAGFSAPVGAGVSIEQANGDTTPGEVIGFRDGRTLVYPLGALTGIRRGATVRLEARINGIRVSNDLLGRIVNGRGQTIDDDRDLTNTSHVPIDQPAPAALARPVIDTP
ncbi:MAG TPA: EscN/YscN/HrcN family type III secretion system ATPase, partial [Planctomycetaceae bacterium]|nr:EscN/YscN/HrcN family type III secretion system ATPase [Planctomycetaceae bacterium]